MTMLVVTHEMGFARRVADLVVVLTDGETPWPAVRPKRPVIVGLMCDEHSRIADHVPQWARVVNIPLDDLSPSPR